MSTNANRAAAVAGCSAQRSELVTLAADLSRLAVHAGDGIVAEKAQRRLEHLASPTLAIAFVGDFKRGKSTLVNVLVGTNVLPMGGEPAAAITHRIVHGDQSGATLLLRSGERMTISAESLSLHVAQFTATHAAAIDEVVVTCNGDFFGVELLDTPGLDEASGQMQRTYAQFPFVDVAVLVTGASVTVAEITALRALLRNVGRSGILFAVNLPETAGAADRQRAADQVTKAVQPVLGKRPQIFTLSALAGLTAKRKGDEKGVRASGAEAFERALRDLAGSQREILKLQAANETLDGLLLEIEESEKAGAVARAHGSDRRAAQLVKVLANLSSATEDIEAWFERAKEKETEFIASIAQRENALTIELCALALELFKSIAFSTKDVDDRHHRHERIARAVNTPLSGRYRTRALEIQDYVRNTFSGMRDELGALSKAWQEAYAEDFATGACQTDRGAAKPILDDGQLSVEIAASLDAISLAPGKFETFLSANYRRRSVAATLNSMGRALGLGVKDITKELWQSYAAHLPSVTKRAAAQAAIGELCNAAGQAAFSTITAHVGQLFDQIYSETRERNLTRKLRHREFESTQHAQDEHAQAVLNTCNELKQRASQRRERLIAMVHD